MPSTDSDKNLRLYMDEICKTELLTPEEEVELAVRIKQGDERARTHMIKANLRLVVKIARDYTGYGLPLADLIAEGNIGLMKAVERFNPHKGAKLSTYASWWIKQGIKRALGNQSKTIRLPIHVVDKVSKIRRIASDLTEVLGREPSDEELAEETGIPLRKLSLLRQASQRSASLDAPFEDNEKMNWGDIVGDEQALNPLDSLIDRNLHDQISELLETLDKREQRIIDARFGLNGKKPMKLEDVGREFGVTRERIRQLQNKALEKMKLALHRKDHPLPPSMKEKPASP